MSHLERKKYKPIRIRGHNVACLQDFLIAMAEKYKPIRIRGHNVACLQDFLIAMAEPAFNEEAYIRTTLRSWNKSREAHYTDKTTKKIIDICNKLFENPQQEIKIVSGLDDICKANCTNRNNFNCGANNPKGKAYDSKVADSYGLIINKTYLAKDLLEKLGIYEE